MVRIGTALRDKDMPNPGVDRPFEAIRPTLASIAKPRPSGSGELVFPELTPISHQGDTGTCVANAWCDALEILDGFDGKDRVEQLSRMFLYWAARYLTGTTHRDDGTYLRAAAHQLQHIGVVEEQYYPFKRENLFQSPPLKLFTMASNNRIKGHYRLTTRGEQLAQDIETAIRASHPVVFGTAVHRGLGEHRGGEVLNHPVVWSGWHAMVVVGVRRAPDGSREFLWRNSWGKDWGVRGYAWASEEYMTWTETQDLWVGTKMEPLI